MQIAVDVLGTREESSARVSLLQTIKAIVRSKRSVVQDCAAGCRGRVPPCFHTLENQGMHWWPGHTLVVMER